jgi:hypothetical protein
VIQARGSAPIEVTIAVRGATGWRAADAGATVAA